MQLSLCVRATLTVLFFFAQLAHAGTWQAKPTPLASPWANQVDPNRVLPEHPRPTMVRPDWQNLNGIWQFEEKLSGDKLPHQRTLKEKILVPFAWESGLSGIRRQMPEWQAWYRKEVEIDQNWRSNTVLLHFGAVDWSASVFVNGHFIGEHKGGFDPFYFDITDALSNEKKQEIIVAVFDPGNREAIASGKQNNARFAKPERYAYSPVSGIWQTVWLESVPRDAYITAYRATPDIDTNTVSISVDVNSHRNDKLMFKARVLDKGQVISESTGSVISVTPLRVKVPKAKLWWPQRPFLYDLEIQLINPDKKSKVDEISGYFGMRKIALGDYYRNNHGPVKRIMLNNQFLFQFGPLDQGYWPAGLYTAPTDEALRWELEEMKRWGFNMVRKHIKVEPARWFYWADKLGILVWQDMPSTFKERTEAEKTQFETEVNRIVKSYWNHPSVVNWILFNEHWGAYDVNRLTRALMELDRSRLITGNSGIDAGEPDIDYEVGHIKDNHRYNQPDNPFASNTRAVVNGEYGGLGYRVSGHLWDSDGPWVHAKYGGREAVNEKYLNFIKLLQKYKDRDELSGAVYTQWTDVENEVNGFYTYDRKVEKLNREQVTKANFSLWENDIELLNEETHGTTQFDTKRENQTGVPSPEPDGGPESINP